MIPSYAFEYRFASAKPCLPPWDHPVHYECSGVEPKNAATMSLLISAYHNTRSIPAIHTRAVREGTYRLSQGATPNILQIVKINISLTRQDPTRIRRIHDTINIDKSSVRTDSRKTIYHGPKHATILHFRSPSNETSSAKTLETTVVFNGR